MCGIAGFYQPGAMLTKQPGPWETILTHMNQVQKHRGPDDEGIYLNKGCGLAHVRLKIIDPAMGHQPMCCRTGDREYTIVFNGELYDMKERRKELLLAGAVFHTSSDTEVLLQGYLLYGADYIRRVNGIFAAAIWDSYQEKLFLFRDRLGVKPLFYTFLEQTLIFSSEIKGLFAYPGVTPALDKNGLCEVFALGPAKSYGSGVFYKVSELLPGEYLCYDRNGLHHTTYWSLSCQTHTDSPEQTIEHTSWLIQDAVRKQMLSDVPICTFLSGGVDSSLVTAICARELQKQGKQLTTFSFDFENNDRYFQANHFQPSQDRPWVEQMVHFSDTRHSFLECSSRQQYDYLFRAVDARDLPCMADVESSMLYFCSQVSGHCKVALTGECADEIFGGYPWFHSAQAFDGHHFPWCPSMEPRKQFLQPELLRELPLDEYARSACEKTVQETPLPENVSFEERQQRVISYLNLRWFMATLLDRMDRTSMFSGLEARVPMADHRIVEYLWNVPWQLKCPGGMVKGLLRQAGEGLLPPEILWRQKSPYPKTYDPAYEALLKQELREVLASPSAPLRQFLNTEKLLHLLDRPSDYGKPWYGQLMAGPQLIAYYLQINYWMDTYHIQLL